MDCALTTRYAQNADTFRGIQKVKDLIDELDEGVKNVHQKVIDVIGQLKATTINDLMNYLKPELKQKFTHLTGQQQEGALERDLACVNRLNLQVERFVVPQTVKNDLDYIDVRHFDPFGKLLMGGIHYRQLGLGRDNQKVGLQALYDALARNDLEWAARLVKQGVGDKFQDEEGDSLLHSMLKAGREDIVVKLIEAGLDPEKYDRGGDAPIHLAIKGGLFRVVEALFAKEVCLVDTDCNGETPFELLLKYPDRLLQFIKAGVPFPLNTKDDDEYTPLAFAIKGDCPEVVEVLLRRGAPLYYIDEEVEDVDLSLEKALEGQGCEEVTPLEFAQFYQASAVYEVIRKLEKEIA